MTEDYKYLVNPPPQPKGPSPWLLVLAGVTLGVLAAGGIGYKLMVPKPAEEQPAVSTTTEPEKKPEKKPEKRNIEISAEPVKAQDMPPGAGMPPSLGGTTVIQPQNKRPSFDFYTILPDLESIVSDAELARTNPKPGVGSQVIEGMPPATAQATAAPAVQPVLPPPAGFQPQPGAGAMPPPQPAPQTASQPLPPPKPATTAPAAAPPVAAATPPAAPPAAPPKAPTPPATAAVTPPATPPAAPQVTPPSESSVYTLQFGSFRSGGDADRIRGELALLGVNADVQQVQVNNQVYFRVRSGPYNGGSISRVQQRLNEHHIQHIVMKAK